MVFIIFNLTWLFLITNIRRSLDLFLPPWMWQCKGCSVAVASRSELLNHYKLKHPYFGRTVRYPYTYWKCPCSFKTWNALIVHQSRVHSTHVCQTQKELYSFSCHLCTCKHLSNEREFFVHINTHLRKNENVCWL